jgi:hypothetical protein
MQMKRKGKSGVIAVAVWRKGGVRKRIEGEGENNTK